MKSCRPIVLLLSAVWLLTLAACGPTAFRTRLAGADSLLSLHPDSALHVLRSWEADAGRARKSDRMYWRLLLADAENKCYVDQTSDSAMKAVADYYDSHGTANEQVRAHYLLGCAYRDMSDAPQALQCYQDAVDRADTTSKDCDYGILLPIYAQMADLFHAQNLPLDELRARNNYTQCALHLGDSLRYIRGYELTTKPYFLMGDSAKVLEILENAHRMYKAHGYMREAVSLYGPVIDFYINKNRLEEARRLMNVFETKSGLFDENGNIGRDRTSYYYIKGKYYIKVMQLDSAELYMRKLLVNHCYVDAYRGLLTIYRLEGNADSIAAFSYLYESSLDSLNNMIRTKAVHQMSSLYDYHRYQQMAEHIATEAKLLQFRIIIIFGIMAAIIAASLLLYMNYRKKKQREIEKLSIEYNATVFKLEKAKEELDMMSNNDARIVSMKMQDIVVLQSEVKEYEQLLQPIKVNKKETAWLKGEIVSLLREKVKSAPNSQMPSHSIWNIVVRQFCKNMSSSYTYPFDRKTFSPKESYVYILIVLGFDNYGICRLLEMKSQQLTNIKTSINNKLFGESSAQTLIDNMQKKGMIV